MMEFLSKLLTTLIVLTSIALVLFVAYIAVTAYLKNKRTEELMKKKKRGEGFVPSLIKINFPNAKIIRNAEFQVANKNGGFDPAPADLVLVETCGIMVISLCGENGAVDNSENGATWTVTAKDCSYAIPNPIDANKNAMQALSSLLAEEGVYNVPIYNVAVFYGKKVVYRNRSPKALTAKTLLSTLKDLNREKFLDSNEISETYQAIRRHLPKKIVAEGTAVKKKSKKKN